MPKTPSAISKCQRVGKPLVGIEQVMLHARKAHICSNSISKGMYCRLVNTGMQFSGASSDQPIEADEKKRQNESVQAIGAVPPRPACSAMRTWLSTNSPPPSWLTWCTMSAFFSASAAFSKYVMPPAVIYVDEGTYNSLKLLATVRMY